MTEQEQTQGTETVETTETTRVVETATHDDPAGTTPAGAAADLGKVRELVLKANPDVVPDLVIGNSVDELIASVEPARSAYQRVADAVRQGSSTQAETVTETTSATTQAPAVATPPAVPAGGAQNVVDPSSLSPTTKIAQGLAQQRRG